MSFQVGNVLNPNKPQNTVIFSILEAKDYKTNLLLCLERFKTHVLQFSKIKLGLYKWVTVIDYSRQKF